MNPPSPTTKCSLMEFLTLGVKKAILDTLLCLEDHVSPVNAMTTLTSPSLAAVTACLAPVWYVSQEQQAGTASSVRMAISETLWMRRTVSVSPELRVPLTELIYYTSEKLISSWVGLGDEKIVCNTMSVASEGDLCTAQARSAHSKMCLCPLL